MKDVIDKLNKSLGAGTVSTFGSTAVYPEVCVPASMSFPAMQ
jgi:hypothetical protein